MQVGVEAAWLTVNVWPAMFKFALRGLVLVFAVAHQVKVPPPVPVGGEQVSQLGSLLEGVQAQVRSHATLTVPLLAPEPIEAPPGERE